MSKKRFVNVLFVTVAPLAFAVFSASASAECYTWSTTCTVDPVEIYGSNPPPDPYDPYGGLFPGGGGGSQPPLPPLVQQALDAKGNADGVFNDLCYRSGETVADWLSRGRVAGLAQYPNNAPVGALLNDILAINAGASSFSGLLGGSNAVLNAAGISRGTLSPRPC